MGADRLGNVIGPVGRGRSPGWAPTRGRCPTARKYVPRVAITGGIRSFVTITPLNRADPGPRWPAVSGPLPAACRAGCRREWVTKRMLVKPHEGGRPNRSMAARRPPGWQGVLANGRRGANGARSPSVGAICPGAGERRLHRWRWSPRAGRGASGRTQQAAGPGPGRTEVGCHFPHPARRSRLATRRAVC